MRTEKYRILQLQLIVQFEISRLLTVIRDINYTKYKKVLKNYNHKTFIYNVHVKMVAWGL